MTVCTKIARSFTLVVHKRIVKLFYSLLGLVQSRVMYARQESVFDVPHRQEGHAMVAQRASQVAATNTTNTTTTLPFLHSPVQI